MWLFNLPCICSITAAALLAWSNSLTAQTQPDSIFADLHPDLLEDQLEQSPGKFEFEDSFEHLARYREKPLPINHATEGELRELGLLSERQIAGLLAYRSIAGKLLSLYELQAVPGFDLSNIRQILPYVMVSTELDDFQVGIGKMLRSGRNEIQLRCGRFLEQQKGFSVTDSGRGYLGDPNQIFLRFRHTYYNRLSYGLVGDKDRGEPFRNSRGKTGFSFYSAHFFLHRYNAWLRALAIGDFRLSTGQGLVAIPGFGFGKSALATAVKRGAPALRAHASSGESGFLRGIAATLDVSKTISITPFLSWRKRDGNIADADSLGLTTDTESGWTSSIAEAGLHRTADEIARKGSLTHRVAGILVNAHFRQLQIGLNALHNSLNPGFYPRPRPYNRFFFRGENLLNLSLDYSYQLGTAQWFGEFARSSNGAVALVNGIQLSPDKTADLALHYRYLPRHYQAIAAAPFADGSGARNESGIYLGLALYPAPGFSVNTYADFWQHPWLRYAADRPGRGQEYRLRITYEKRRDLLLYAEMRHRTTEENARGNNATHNQTLPVKNLYCRLHLSKTIGKQTELRTRIDWGMGEFPGIGRQQGILLLQDILYRPIQSPVSFSARYAIFSTPGYHLRFYHFENDLLNTFSIPPYFGNGARVYFNLRTRLLRSLTWEFRFAQTYRHDGAIIGTGLEAFEGNRRTQIASQIKWIF